MSEAGRVSALSLLTLREIRGYIRRSHAVAMTVFFGILYALGSMVLGTMLILTRLPPPYYTEIIWSPGLGQPPWDFPALIIWAPWGAVTLPWFATWATVLVSMGVAIGMSVAVLLSAQLIRMRRSATGGPTAIGSVAGLTPAMLAVVTLGACCGTTAAATAGVGAVAQITGSNADNLLVNNWFLGVFQIAVVWIALLAQEMLLQVYGDVIGVSRRARSGTAPAVVYRPPAHDRKFVAGVVLRTALLLAGVSWALAMLVGWTLVPPLAASAAQWTAWILEYELVAILAVMAALFPRELARWFSLAARRPAGYVVRGAALLGGLALVAWVPPPWSGWGIEGFGNELLGVLGAPSSWGAIAPVFPAGPVLYLRWAFQYLLLGGFAITVALLPGRAFSPLEATVGETVVAGSHDENPPAGRAPSVPSDDSDARPSGLTAPSPDPIPSSAGAQAR